MLHRLKVHTILIAVAGVLVILLAQHLGLFEGVNSYCYNLSFRLRGPVTPSQDIQIVAIDEKSLHQLGRWPLRRSHYASLLDLLHKASAVGFTVIMAEPTGDDLLLAQAADRHGKIAFPLYIDNRLQVEYPVQPLARFPAGHLHIEQDMNGFAKGVFNNISLGSHPLPLLAAMVQKVADRTDVNTEPVTPQNPSLAGESVVIKQNDLMQINYYGPPGTFPVISLADILNKKIPPEIFTGKFILVGPTAAGIEERMMTPFAQFRDRMSAVEIQANILSNLIDRNSIRTVSENKRFIACLIVAVVLFPLFMLMAETGATMLWLFTLTGVVTSGYLLFARLNLWVDPGQFIVAISFLYFITMLFKLDDAARKLQLECSTIARHLAPEAMPPFEEKAFAGIFSHLSTGGINRKVSILDEATRLLMQRSTEIETANRELGSKNSQLAELQVALKARVEELETALDQVKQLEGIIPICMYCKKIRNDQDYWQILESYLAEHADIIFSHGICPDCYQEKIREIEAEHA